MKNIDFREDLSKVKCQTLVICGEKDTANLKASNNIHKILKSSEIFLIPDSKHEVNIDNPKLLSRILFEFYDSI